MNEEDWAVDGNVSSGENECSPLEKRGTSSEYLALSRNNDANACESRVFHSATNPADDSAAAGSGARRSSSPEISTAGACGPAARKRELERQRRNLVSTRFAELDEALSTDMSASCSGAKRHIPARRIDKEAILKDAATRLTALSVELKSANQRLASMNTEVENLRAEKVELRNDKAYLRSELVSVRSEVHRLRTDNIHLWQAIRRSGGLKSILSADVAKIPANILLRSQNSVNSTVMTPHTQTQQTVVQPRPLQNPQVSVGLAPTANVGSSEAAHADQSEHDTTSLVDSFLVFQSAEELGDLFANLSDNPSGSSTGLVVNSTVAERQRPSNGEQAYSAASRAMPANVSTAIPRASSTQVLQPDHPSYQSHSMAHLTMQSVGQMPINVNEDPTESYEGSQPNSAHTRQVQQPSIGNFSAVHSAEPEEKNDDGDQNDLLADIAYCA